MNIRKITWAEKVQSSAVFAVCSDWTGIYISSLIGWHSRLCFLLRCSYKKSETCVNLIELKSVSRQGIMPQLPQYHSNGCLRQKKIKKFHTALSRIKQKLSSSLVPGIVYILPYPQNLVDTADKLQHVKPLSVWACRTTWTDFDLKDLSEPITSRTQCNYGQKTSLKKLHAFNYLQNPAGKRD